MSTQNLFTATEAEKINTSYRKSKKVIFKYLVVGLLINIIISFVASLQFRSLLIPLLILTISLTLVVFYFIFYKHLKKLKKDVAEQIKIMETLKVISKSEEKKVFSLTFDSGEFKSITVDEDVFNQVIVGDNLEVEYGKYSNYLFKLSKDSKVLKNGS